MKFNDLSTLANHMSRALAAYANHVQNGDVAAFMPLLAGADTVTLTITLVGDGSIVVKPFAPTPDPTPEPAPRLPAAAVEDPVDGILADPDPRPSSRRKRL